MECSSNTVINCRLNVGVDVGARVVVLSVRKHFATFMQSIFVVVVIVIAYVCA